MKSVNRYISVFLLFLVTGLAANSQTEVKISKEKVSIDGVPYYIHIVKQGQTLYSISKTYHVSTETLLKENRTAVYGLKEGDPIKIPVVSLREDIKEVSERDPEKFVYHTLREGETVFALSRKYNIPEEQIKESNPNVDVFDIPVGAEIAIPRKKFKEEPKYFRTDTDGFRLHKVRRGESLSDIAEMYNITVRQLRNANRRLIFPKVGEYIRIPSGEVTFNIDADEEIDKVDSMMLEDENITLLFDGTNIDYTPVENLEGSVDVALLLPLYLKENSQRTYIDSSEYYPSGKKKYKKRKRSEEWIYPWSQNFIEFYEGVLLAVDEMRSRGLSIDLSVFDTAGDSLVVDSLIKTGELRDADLIIGPVYSYNVDEVSRYARRYRIPIVSPLATRNRDVLKGNPYLFKVQPSMEVVEEAMAKTISRYHYYNLVFVHSDTAWSEDLSSGFKNNIYRKLRYVVPYDEINFRMVFHMNRSATNDTINVIEHALSKERPNLVIIASNDEAVMSAVVVNVHTLLRNYDIKIIGYPGLRWLDRLDPLYVYDLEAMLFTQTWVDYEQDDVKDFIRKYRSKFNMEPQIRSYAWQSYDITYYFLSGIAIHGSQFKYQPWKHRPDLLQVDYDFSRTGLTNGFENNRLFLIRYTPEKSVTFPQFDERDFRE